MTMGSGPRWKATGMGFTAVLAAMGGPRGPARRQRSAVGPGSLVAGAVAGPSGLFDALDWPLLASAPRRVVDARDCVEEDVMGALDGKVAIVTGGASGIGLASSRRLTAEGATVVVVDANGDGSREGGVGARWRGRAGRRRQVGDWARIVDAARRLGGVDIAYLNAGVTTGEEDITKVTDEQYRRILSVNVDGIVFGTRAVVPELVARGGGAVVATSSLAGIVAFAGRPDVHLDQACRGGFRALRWRPAWPSTTSPSTPSVRASWTRRSSTARSATAWPGSGSRSSPPEAVAEAVLGCVVGERPVRRSSCSWDARPVAYRFGRPPGPRAPGVEGRIPPSGWPMRARRRPSPPAEGGAVPAPMAGRSGGQGRPAPTSPLVQIPVTWMFVPVSMAWTISPGPTYIVTCPMVPPSR